MEIEVRKPVAGEVEAMSSWPIWECEVSEFDWHYDDREVCYLLEGEVAVKTATETVTFAAGDVVAFPKGLDCFWKVTVPVKKHYVFG